MNRREAIKRTALLFGVAASPATISRALAELSDGSSARYLTPSQFKIVEAMAERLLPAGDTPGATDAGVASYVDIAYGLFIDGDARNSLRTGLAYLDRMRYDHMSGDEQDAVIRDIANNNAEPGKDWLRQFRSLSFAGYFTSEAAAKSGFVWDPVPGGYESCQPLSASGGASYFE
ncbi:MAG: lactose 3-dehydrogenase subunit gamma LacC [Synoicihabitans sp.]